jgi:hypothetical protein
MDDHEEKVKEFRSRNILDLDNCTKQDKRDAYTHLDLKVIATQKGVDIKGYFQSELLTIG